MPKMGMFLPFLGYFSHNTGLFFAVTVSTDRRMMFPCDVVITPTVVGAVAENVKR